MCKRRYNGLHQLFFITLEMEKSKCNLCRWLCVHLSLSFICRWLLSAFLSIVLDGDVASRNVLNVVVYFFWQTPPNMTQTKNSQSLHLYCYTLSLSLSLSPLLLLFCVQTVPPRTSRLSGASSRQPGGHEEQERGESGRHPPGHEALPVPLELLRAGNDTRRLHPRRGSRPGTLF